MKTLLMAIFTTVLILSLSAVGTKATPLTGGKLLIDCKVLGVANAPNAPEPSAIESFDGGMCLGYMLGYMEGVNDMMVVIDKVLVTVVFREGVTPGQMARVYVIYMAKHPEEETNSAAQTVTNAMFDAKLVTVVPVKSETPTLQ
jgi:hypothetical protein